MLSKGIKLLKHKHSAAYSKAMYEAWKSNPEQVH